MEWQNRQIEVMFFETLNLEILMLLILHITLNAMVNFKLKYVHKPVNC